MSSVFLAGLAYGDVESRVAEIKIQNLYAPFGYDDNDEVVVVLDGYLPDTCFKLASTQVEHQGDKIVIKQHAREYSGNCFDVTVPFTVSVKLGVLPRGSYEVVAGNAAQRLSVKEATKAGPDDYLYAPVENARVENNTAILSGRFTNSCLKIESVQRNHTGNTVQILPIMKLQTPSEAGKECVAGEFPFEHKVSLTDLNLDKARHLLHVRSLDGQSVNSVFKP